jgi:DNA-binding response OmpR family regulator
MKMKKGKTIFIIEDSKILSEIISLNVYKKLNSNNLTFENGDDAMEQMLSNAPDLIILDYNFNAKEIFYKTGLEFLKELRKTSEVPVIVFSGQKNKEVELDLIRLGVNNYIHKEDDDFMDILIGSIEDVFKD